MIKYVAFFWFLHGITGHACGINRRLLLLCFIHTRHYSVYFNVAVSSVKY